MNIAIVGAGLAGLSALWHLLQYPQLQVTLFDARGIGQGASKVSTGLLHPFPGKEALRSWEAKKGMEATLCLVDVAEKTLNQRVALRTGILRIAISEQQKVDFFHCASENAEAIWLEEEAVVQKIPGVVRAPALWIPSGVTVYSSLYLEGLWQACAQKGARFVAKEIHALEELDAFDGIIIAAGDATLQFKECRHLRLKRTKGQTLLCRGNVMLPFSIASLGHISPIAEPCTYQIGSTYERHFTSRDPDPQEAYTVLQKAAMFYPPVQQWEVLEVQAGVRISPMMGYRPLVEQITPKAWVFTGLGSRGLLYHAMLGEQLAHQIAKIHKFA